MKNNKLWSILKFVLMVILIFILFSIFKSHYFNGFIKAETTVGISEFRRDNNVKYSDMDSYKITSPSQNDAAFYKEIKVEPHTPYRMTCMVKTENVIPSAVNTDGGACISIIEAPEISKSITGTNDWQKVELMFNSNDRTNIRIGFRLGGNSGKAKGTAWFSDFKLEKGLVTEDSNWKVACFIFENTSVEVDGQAMNFSMSTVEMETVKDDMEDFKYSCKKLSDGRMTVDYDIYKIKEPITTISYSEEHKYYFDPYDVNKQIENTVLENNYDYIFIVAKMGNNEKEIPVNNWVGLRKYGFIWNWFCKYKICK